MLCAISYFVSYLTRINYSAVLVEMVADTGFAKTALSVALTGNFIAYGIGQILSGIIGDKFQPKHLVFSGFLVSSVMNAIIPFCASPWQMTLVWSINGFAQALMWPPMVRLLVNILSDLEYQKATIKVSYGSSLGTVAVFLISPALISFFGWRSVFLFSAFVGIIMMMLWWCYCPTLSAIPQKATSQKNSGSGFKITFLFVAIMFAIVLQGALRDGVTTWTPTYINEIYNFGSEIAILTSVVLPIFSMCCHGAFGTLYYKVFKNPILLAGIIFSLGTLAATGLLLLTGKNAVISLICLAVLVGAMHGVNLMLVCLVPAFYKNTGKISFVSGLINSCTYLGSALSTYGIALLSEKGGWGLTIGIWCIIALAGALICFAIIPSWKKQMNN